MAATDDRGSGASFEASDAGLKRRIGLWGLIGLAVSLQVGASWLLATLAAASMAGPAALVAWVVGAAFFGVIGVAWMEIGTMLPRSGSAARYPHLTHGAFLGWFNGWGYLVAAVALPAIEAQAALTYIGGQWPQLGLLTSDGGVTIVAWPNGVLTGWAMLIVFFLLNVFGARLLGETNKWVTLWKVAIPVATFVLLFTAFKSANLVAFGGFAPEGVGAILGAVSSGGIVFAYAGLRQILDFGGEVKNPQRNIPIAMYVGGLAIPLVLYLMLQLGFLGALDWGSAGVTAGDWGALLDSEWASSPLLQALAVAGFGSFAMVLLTDAVLSPSATGWVWLGIASRTAYSSSVNGDIPGIFRRINRFGVPGVALAACTVVGFVFFAPGSSWYRLVGMVSTALVLTYLLGGPMMMVLRRTAADYPRPIRVRGAKFWAAAGYVASLWVLYFAGWTTLVNLLTVVLFALPVYGAYISVRNGWSPAAWSRVLAAAFTACWAVAAWKGGWVLTSADGPPPGSWPFAVYFGVFSACTVGFLAVLWLLSSATGRRHLRAGLWLVVTLLVTLLLAYLGQYGPLPHPVIASGVDLVVVGVLGLASYWWAVRSGFATDRIAEVVAEGRRQDPDTRASVR